MTFVIRKNFLLLGWLALMNPVLSAAPSEKLQELRKERREIEREIRKLVPDPNKRDPELEELQRASLKATRAYEQTIDNHPNLQKFKDEKAAATTKLTAAISKGDSQAKEAAQAEITDVMRRRMEAAAKEPDLQPLAKASQEAGAAYFARNKEVLASLPETKSLAAKLETLNARIQEELKKQR